MDQNQIPALILVSQIIYHHSLSFVPEAMDCLYEYSWPGNVRELENVVERLVVLSQTGIIDKADLLEEIRQGRQKCSE